MITRREAALRLDIPLEMARRHRHPLPHPGGRSGRVWDEHPPAWLAQSRANRAGAKPVSVQLSCSICGYSEAARPKKWWPAFTYLKCDTITRRTNCRAWRGVSTASRWTGSVAVSSEWSTRPTETSADVSRPGREPLQTPGYGTAGVMLTTRPSQSTRWRPSPTRIPDATNCSVVTQVPNASPPPPPSRHQDPSGLVATHAAKPVVRTWATRTFAGSMPMLSSKDGWLNWSAGEAAAETSDQLRRGHRGRRAEPAAA